MIQYLKIQQIPHRRLDLLDARIAKLNHFTTIHTDEMVMLLKAMGLFILRQVLAKLVLGDQVTTDQELEGIVYCSPADPIV